MRWKWIAGIGVFLISALLVTAYAVLATYDYSNLKPRIERMVKNATGRDLSLGGEIEVTFGFLPSLTVTDVVFANASWGSQPHMIKIDKLQLHVRLLPLLYKDLVLKYISLAGVDVLLETDANENGNWNFNSADRPKTNLGMFVPSEFDIDNTRIENLQVAFREGQTGTLSQYTLKHLDVTSQTDSDDLLINLQTDYKGQSVELVGKTGRIHQIFSHERFPVQLSGTIADNAVTLEGVIDDLLNLAGIDLEVEAKGEDLAAFGVIKGIHFPKTTSFDLKGYLKGSKASLKLENFSGNLTGNVVSIDISGFVDNLLVLSGIDVRLKGSGKDLVNVGKIVGEKLPATDKFELQGRLTGSTQALVFEEIQGSASGGSLHVAVNGAVNDLLALGGLDLQSHLTGKDLAEFGKIIGVRLPATETFELHGRLKGSTKVLTLQKAQGNARRNSLRLTVNGTVKDLLTLGGMDLQSSLAGKDLTEFGKIIGVALPATETFEFQGRLQGSTKVLALQKAQGSASRGSLRLTVNGTVKDLLTLGGMDLQSSLGGQDLTEFGKIIGVALPATDIFELEGRLKGSTKVLALQNAQGSARHGSMGLTVSGGVTQLLTLEGIDVNLNASGEELAEIGSLVDADLPKLGPFKISGQLKGSTKGLSMNGFSAIIDKSDFKGLAKAEFHKKPKITMRLESSVVDFTAFMNSFEKDKPKTGETKKLGGRLFSEDPLPFDILQAMDADIVLKARNIHAKDARFELGHLTLKLEDRDLHLDKFEATYEGAKISGTFQVNHGSPPRVETSFIVQNLDLGGLVKELGVSDEVEGDVDIAASLKSRGSSTHSLMANLDGEFGGVMGEGYLSKYLDLISIDLSHKVLPFWGSNPEGNQIKCAVVNFDIKSGVATSQAFVFHTQIGVLSGGGEIDLGKEQIDFLLVPKPKHPGLFKLATKLRVSGSIMNPGVRPYSRSLLTKGAKAASFFVIGPLGLLAPFVHLGAHNAHPCDIPSINEIGMQVPADK